VAAIALIGMQEAARRSKTERGAAGRVAGIYRRQSPARVFAADQITADNVENLRVPGAGGRPKPMSKGNPSILLALRTSRNEDTPLFIKGVMYHVTAGTGGGD